MARDKVTLVLTAREAKALQEHFKQTILATMSGQSVLENVHTKFVDAMCRAVKREKEKQEKDPNI